MKSAYSIAPSKILYKNTVMLQNFNARIVCPYCHIPLAVADLEEATLDGRPLPDLPGVLDRPGQPGGRGGRDGRSGAGIRCLKPCSLALRLPPALRPFARCAATRCRSTGSRSGQAPRHRRRTTRMHDSTSTITWSATRSSPSSSLSRVTACRAPNLRRRYLGCRSQHPRPAWPRRRRLYQWRAPGETPLSPWRTGGTGSREPRAIRHWKSRMAWSSRSGAWWSASSSALSPDPCADLRPG